MHKQKGFSLVEGLLIVLIITMVGAGGWHVMNQNSDESLTPETTEQLNQYGNESSESKNVAEETIPDGWNKYENSVFGLSFIVPDEWRVEITPEGYEAESNTNFRNTIILKSSDYELEDTNGAKPVIDSGQRIVINRSENYIRLNDIMPSTISELKEMLIEEPSIDYGYTTPVELMIDSKDALYNECGHDRPIICYKILINANELLTINAAPLSEETKNIVNTFIDYLIID